MKVAVHQPNYLPWIGYFRKIAISDLFVIFDDVQFEKGGYTNRVNIRISDQAKWLTEPINKRGILKSTINDIEFVADNDWRKNHFDKIASSYGKRPFYFELKEVLLSLFDNDFTRLSDFNSAAIESFVTRLNLNVGLVRSSTLDYNRDESASHKLVSICRIFGGDVYCSGRGGKNYNDEKLFLDSGVSVEYDDGWRATEYSQGANFIPGLSIVDAIANVGFEQVRSMIVR